MVMVRDLAMFLPFLSLFGALSKILVVTKYNSRKGSSCPPHTFFVSAPFISIDLDYH
jgi:hypothetical protein